MQDARLQQLREKLEAKKRKGGALLVAGFPTIPETRSGAVPTGKPKGRGTVACRHSSPRFFNQAKNLSSRPQNDRHDAATLLNSLEQKSHFPLNHDN
ncbi:hypothetical protein TBK1r_64550 [Stieleria magnilauensis]|uniref:Uncharacterized protein n=1 Tax=Stieleria magnilauensis TaxID=2527963 RepID=A0ABX5Y0X8_9BACT|nr:hypothetical protein TBK1r_64550 [Planctomycetes bacterium TBK1r]